MLLDGFRTNFPKFSLEFYDFTRLRRVFADGFGSNFAVFVRHPMCVCCPLCGIPVQLFRPNALPALYKHLETQQHSKNAQGSELVAWLKRHHDASKLESLSATIVLTSFPSIPQPPRPAHLLIDLGRVFPGALIVFLAIKSAQVTTIAGQWM